MSILKVVTVSQRTLDPVAPPPAPEGTFWQWLGTQVVSTNASGGEDRYAWHTFGLYPVVPVQREGTRSPMTASLLPLRLPPKFQCDDELFEYIGQPMRVVSHDYSVATVLFGDGRIDTVQMSRLRLAEGSTAEEFQALYHR